MSRRRPPPAEPPSPRDGEVAFDPARARRVELFFERVLVHTKGRWARSPFVLRPWQAEDIIRPLMGTVRYDAQVGAWVRAFTEAWLELPRGNGKSPILGGLGLYLLLADGEEGAEIYGAAAGRDQASLVYRVMRRTIDLSPVLDQLVRRGTLKVIDSQKTIVHVPTDSVYRVIAADAAGNLGQGPHGVLFDEIVSQPNRDLYDVLRTGLGKRSQPLFLCATTAGPKVHSFAGLEHREAARVSEEPGRAPNRFVYIRAVDEKADPWNEQQWHHANPALGDFLSLAQLRAEAAAARADPTKEAAFRAYRLNQWVGGPTRAVPLPVWDASAGMVIPEDLHGRRAFAGLDLAATTDLASLILLFPPDTDEAEELGEHPFHVLARFWVPAGAADTLDQATGGALRLWERQGRLTVVEGDVIDYGLIHRQLDQDRRNFGLVDVSLDPWNSSQTIAWCETEGITAVAVSQTFRALSPPTKELLRLIRQRRLMHGGDPVLRWNIDSLELKRDNSDNVRPVKPDRGRTGARVDGAIALILALDGYLRRGSNLRRSAYEEHGIQIV